MPLYPTAVLSGPQLTQLSPKLAPLALMLNMLTSQLSSFIQNALGDLDSH